MFPIKPAGIEPPSLGDAHVVDQRGEVVQSAPKRAMWLVRWRRIVHDPVEHDFFRVPPADNDLAGQLSILTTRYYTLVARREKNMG